MSESYERYERLMLPENQSFQNWHEAYCLRHDDPKLDKHKLLSRLPEVREGYQWYYYCDVIPLSGCEYWVELDTTNRLVGATYGFCIH